MFPVHTGSTPQSHRMMHPIKGRAQEHPRRVGRTDVVKTGEITFRDNIASFMINVEINFVIGKLNCEMILLLIILTT